MEGEVWVLVLGLELEGCHTVAVTTCKNKKTMSEATKEKNTQSLTLWNKVLATSVKMPFVKVDRDEFLTKELSKFCTPMEVMTALDDSPFLRKKREGRAPLLLLWCYFARSRYRNVTIWPRVQVSSGENVITPVPLVTPVETAQRTAL